MARSRARLWPVSMIVHSGAGAPPEPTPTRNCATRSIGFCVADRPMRSSLPPLSADSRSSERARCEPRLFGASGVDLVDDHGARRCQHRAAGVGAQEDVERLRRRDDDVRRRLAHAVALGGRGVARAHPGADFDVGQALRLQGRADARERRFQVAVDVVRQRLQRRDVDDLRLVPELRLRAPAAPARRSPRETPPASCRTRWGPRSARAGRPGSPATPAPAPRSAQRSCR